MMGDTEMEAVVPPSGSSSVGEAVSGRGGQNGANDDDDDLFFIPERRPSLDLGPYPMDTSQCHFVERASHPVLSYWSLTSEENLNDIMNDEEDGSFTRIQLNRADSFSSSYSLDSDTCEKRTPNGLTRDKNKDDTVSEPSDMTEMFIDPNAFTHPSLTVTFTLKAICNTLGKLASDDLKTFKMMLWNRYPQSFNTPPQSMDILDLADRMLECFGLEGSLQVTKIFLEEIGTKKMADYLQTLCIRNEVRHDLSEALKRIYGNVREDSAMLEEERPFDNVFTNLHITSTRDNGPNIEHEVMTIEKLDSNKETGKQLSTKEILSPERRPQSHMKLLLLIGVAGSGKSMAVRRLILDWIEGLSHQHVSFLFPLPFRELKQFEGRQISLLEIIQTLYPATKKLRDEDFRSQDCKIMFIFDGLDEYSGELDFQNTKLLCDYTDVATLNVIVVNLLRERLFYRGLFVVTSRPQVRRYVPWDIAYDEIDVLGFCEPEKDEFFRKRFQDQDQAARVIAYINSVKTLRIMCHLPLFCSLVANEYESLFRVQGTQAELPRSITYMYTKLLLALTRQHRRFRASDRSLGEERDFLMKLGKLAFNMLEQNQFKIAKCDWKEVGISDVEAVINSGLCTEYITKPSVLFYEKVLSFIHPTMQEYLAALYAFLSFRNQGKNIFEQQVKHKLMGMVKEHKMMKLYKSAVDRSLLCKDGKLDIFLRFLFGMAMKNNLELLQPLCTSFVKWPTFTEDAAALIRKRIQENQSPGRTNNLHCCLEELGVCASEAASC